VNHAEAGNGNMQQIRISPAHAVALVVTCSSMLTAAALAGSPAGSPEHPFPGVQNPSFD